ncbi:MAG: response regulator [bacterium]|nr:response regulator [bacterium]
MDKKILIVEDEDALSSVLSAKLSREGFEAEVAGDGEAGLKKITAWQPDLILLDIVMPKVNGYEVLEEMAKNNVKIPVIIISNSGQEVELEKIKKLGAVDWIIKTQLDAGEVVDKVKKYLSGSSEAAGKIAAERTADDLKGQEEEGGSSNGVKVLLVEDDSFLRDICYKKLRKEGFSVFAAVDGEEALKKIDEMEPNIVLLDIILPSIDGFEVLKEIRASKNKAVKDVPVIMLTNLGQEEDIKKALGLGASDYLIKANFTTEEIVEKINSKLGLK